MILIVMRTFNNCVWNGRVGLFSEKMVDQFPALTVPVYLMCILGKISNLDFPPMHPLEREYVGEC